VPAVTHVTSGVLSVEVDGNPPLKVHNHEAGLLVQVSVNSMDCPAEMVVKLEVKLATGGTGT